MNIQELIQKISQKGLQIYCKVCKVDSVDKDKRIIDCTPIDGSAQLMEVPLQSVSESTKGICVYPAIGSFVLVGFVDNSNAYVLQCSQVEQIVCDVDDTIIINGGDLGGMVKVGELTDRLNHIEDTFNAFLTEYKAHVHKASTAMPLPPAPSVITEPTISTAQPMQPTVKSKIENDKIKQ